MLRFSLLVCLASSCATSAAQPEPTDPVRALLAKRTAASEAAADRPPGEPVTAAEAAADTPAHSRPRRGDELALWSSPSFRRHLIESYLAETEIEPPVTVDERETMLEIFDLISSDRMDEAAALLREHGGETASAVFDFTLGNVHFEAGRLEEAVGHYEAAIEKFPKFRRAWENLGILRVRRSEFEDALPALTRVIEFGGGDAVAYGVLGYAHASLENHIASESAYRMATLLDPHTVDWQMHLARSFFQQQRYADAVALTRSLIADFPDRADLWLLQAQAYLGLGEIQQAAENYELVDRLGAATAESLTMLGDIYVNDKLFGLGVDAYTRAMESSGYEGPERVLRAAQVLTAHGAFDETLELVEAVEARHGADLATDQRTSLLEVRAQIAVAEGDGEEAVATLERIVELDPMDGEAIVLLGEHAGRTGDVEQAVFYFERAANISGSEAEAKLAHAQLLVRESKYEEALPLLRRVQALEPRESVQQYLEQVERIAKRR